MYLIILSLFLLNCSNSTAPTPPDNTLPVICEILVSPTRPQINQVVKLTAYVHDADKDQLYVSWSASGGSMTNNSYGNPMYWSTPNKVGNYNIFCYLSDLEAVDVKNIIVQVYDDSSPPEES